MILATDKKLVVDASVAVKWVFGNRSGESDLGMARSLLLAIFSEDSHRTGRQKVVSVVARRFPREVATTSTFCMPSGSPPSTTTPYSCAQRGWLRLKQHLFDTLYHAIALERGALLVTADERYFAAASKEGSVQRLGLLELG